MYYWVRKQTSAEGPYKTRAERMEAAGKITTAERYLFEVIEAALRDELV